MLKKLRFKNYRSFKAWQEIELKPLTVLVGPNSAGKSSILKLLGLFAQTRNHDGYEYMRLNGPLAKIGSFQSLANNYNDDPAIIEFTTNVASKGSKTYRRGTTYRWEIGSKHTNLKFSKSNKEPYSFGVKNYLETYDREFFGGRQFLLDMRRGKAFRDAVDAALNELKPIVSWLEMNPPEDNSNLSVRKRLINDLAHPLMESYDGKGLFPTERNKFADDLQYMPLSFSSIRDDKFLSSGHKRFTQIIKQQVSSKKRKGVNELSRWSRVLNELDSSDPLHAEWLSHFGYFLMSEWIKRTHASLLHNYDSKLVELLPQISNHFRTCMNDVHRLGPVRDFRVNTYTRDELQSLLGLEVEYNVGIKKFVDTSLELLGFPFTMEVKELEQPAGQFLIQFQPKNSDIFVPLSEMGFGFTQVLPVIFGALRKGITLFEQPELHLHPLSQARLAKLFTTSYTVYTLSDDGVMGSSIMDPTWSLDWSFFGGKVTEVKFDPTNQVNGMNIIETHSEHFLRGLQLRVAEGAISPQDINVYYVSKNRLGNSSVKEMKIKPNGFFEEEWPKGFFDSASNLQEALWEAQK
jgi:predicted ATPase